MLLHIYIQLLYSIWKSCSDYVDISFLHSERIYILVDIVYEFILTLSVILMRIYMNFKNGTQLPVASVNVQTLFIS